MGLASKIWDNTPPARSHLGLVGSEKDESGMPKTFFFAFAERDLLPHKFSSHSNSIIPITRGLPAGRLNKPYIISQLNRLRDLPLDWNGYNAQPIDLGLIEEAKCFIGNLPGDIIDTPAVVPMTRGRLQFEWHRGNRSLELEFESKGRIHYLKADDDSGIDEEAILFTDQTPEIEALLRWFSSE